MINPVNVVTDAGMVGCGVFDVAALKLAFKPTAPFVLGRSIPISYKGEELFPSYIIQRYTPIIWRQGEGFLFPCRSRGQ
jgi:hypothetical protein